MQNQMSPFGNGMDTPDCHVEGLAHSKWCYSEKASLEEVANVPLRVAYDTQSLPHFLFLVHSENSFFLYIFLPP